MKRAFPVLLLLLALLGMSACGQAQQESASADFVPETSSPSISDSASASAIESDSESDSEPAPSQEASDGYTESTGSEPSPAASVEGGSSASDSTGKASADSSSLSADTADDDVPALETTTFTVNGVDFTMVLVEAGTFTMGSNTTQSALAAHKVTLEQDYLMGETEVTEALWNAVMGSGGGDNTMPQTSVTWDSTFTFLEALNEIAHEQGIIPEDVNFHLPTEEQWEFAAKGGNLSEGYTYSGGNDIDEVAETQENSGTSPVAVKQKAPNELGLYDMSGNAYEWVDATESGGHVKKGGSNYHSFTYESYLYTPEGRYIYSSTDWTIGFRICLF